MRSLACLAVGSLLALVACGDDAPATTGSGGAGATSSSTGAGGDDACAVERRAEDDAAPPPVFTPRWAFRPWISKDISDGPDTYAFVDGFLERDIPVAVVVLDSPWETDYNTFEPNPERYPAFDQMVADLRDKGVRTVLWTTQMMNLSSFDAEPTGDFYEGPAAGYEQAYACDWFVNGGEVSYWWKGQGAGIDFFDPDARAFFHRLQDRVLDAGIAGWKLDFGEQYIARLPMDTDAGPKTLQEYSEAYYADFYAYGAARLGTDEFVTMVRPYDRSYGFEGRFYARPEHAPVTWVGDNRRDDVGLVDALDHTFRSARAGYAVVGSDIGGYLDRDDEDLTVQIPADADNFVRWTAMSIFTPFFQLHGRANLVPWSFTTGEDLSAEYRTAALFHDALVPFFDALTRAAYAGGAMPIRPIGDEADWPGDYRFTLGDAFLVAPVLDGSGSRTVALPAGRTYYDVWDLAAPGVDGGASIEVDTTDAVRIPAWIQDGAIVTAIAHRDAPLFGDPSLEGLTQVLVIPGRDASLTAYAEDGTPSEVTLTTGDDGVTVTLSAVPEPTVVRIRFEADDVGVSSSATITEAAARADLADDEGAYFVDAERNEVLIRLAPGDGEVTVTLSSP